MGFDSIGLTHIRVVRGLGKAGKAAMNIVYCTSPRKGRVSFDFPIDLRQENLTGVLLYSFVMLLLRVLKLIHILCCMRVGFYKRGPSTHPLGSFQRAGGRRAGRLRGLRLRQLGLQRAAPPRHTAESAAAPPLSRRGRQHHQQYRSAPHASLPRKAESQ